MFVALWLAVAQAAEAQQVHILGGAQLPACESYVEGDYSGRDCATGFGLQAEGEHPLGALLLNWEANVERAGQSDVAVVHMVAGSNAPATRAPMTTLTGDVLFRVGLRETVGPGTLTLTGGLLMEGDRLASLRVLVEDFGVTPDPLRAASAGLTFDIAYRVEVSNKLELGISTAGWSKSRVAVKLSQAYAGSDRDAAAQLFRGKIHQALEPALQADIGGSKSLHLELDLPGLERDAFKRGLADEYAQAGWTAESLTQLAWAPTVQAGYRVRW